MKPYFTAARLSRSSLEQAMAEAKGTLPAFVLKQHFIASKHSPTAWRSVERWYIEYGERDATTLNTITDLCLMSEALAALFAVTSEIREGPINLHVSKMRRLA